MAVVTDKAIWVTGSAKRVGREIALELARHGANIVVHCHHSRDEGERTAKEIVALGRRALLVQGDHASRHDVWNMVREIDREFGGLDALVNSASTFPRQSFPDIMDEDFDAAINSNLRGPFICSQLALPLLRKRTPSRIVNILDARISRPGRNYAAYWCAKGGLQALTLALSNELAPGILVNGVAPGPIMPEESMSEEQKNNRAAKTYLKRWGNPGDVAAAVRYLLESDYTTGAILPVDGGYRLA